MDRFVRLRALVEQALDELSRPTALTHEQYTVVATLHAIAREIELLQQERRTSPLDA